VSDVTVVQVEASVVGISFSVNADIFVDPEVASVIVSEEECVTVIGSLTFSRACIGVGVGGTLSDVLAIEVRSISSSAISWSLVPSNDVWVVEFSNSIGDCGNLE